MKIKFIVILALLLLSFQNGYAQGLWTAKATYLGGVDYGGNSFIVGTKIYYIDGGGAADPSELWEYDISTNIWTQKTNFPGAGRSGLAVTLELTDGGSGDADGIVNGVIDDPGGLAFPLVAAANIPTLSEWARIVLISLFNLFGVYYKRNIFS